jgi:acetyl esterase/lipase
MLRLTWLFALALLETLGGRLRRGPLRPGWPLAFEAAIALLRREWRVLGRLPPGDVRAALARRPFPQPVLRRTPTRAATGCPVPARWLEPRGVARGPVLLYLHGGSYLFGSLHTHGELVARLAGATGVRALFVDYRLAPEHRPPAQLEDALAAVRWLRASGEAPGGVWVAGDSAGGHLALALQLALRDAGEPQCERCVLISPWADLAGRQPSRTTHAPYDYGSPEMLLRHARLVAGALPLEDPRLSLLDARLEGLAPLLVQVGGAELLYDEGVALHRRLREAGVAAELQVLEGMPHNACMFAGHHPEGDRALRLAAEHLRQGRAPAAP